MSSSTDGYARMWFKGNKVWARVDESGAPKLKNGRVPVKFKLDQPHEYGVNLKNLRPLESGPGREAPPKKARPSSSPKKKADPGLAATDDPNTIYVFTDGASSGNPGPSGIGVYLRYGSREKSVSRYIGQATNNIAELEAIKTGLSLVKRPDLCVRLFTDSQYAYGLLCQNWKPKKNQELVAAIKQEMSRFSDLLLIKVPGHAGLEGNEKADRLAVLAVQNRQQAK